jgi:hypothetical protein
MKKKGKIALIMLIALSFNIAHSQNKKEQIEALNFSIDSLKNIVNASSLSLVEKNAIISNYEIEIEKLNSTVIQLNSDLAVAKGLLLNKDIELQTILKELNSVKWNYQNIKDSIARANSNQKLDTLIWELTDITWEQLEFDLKLLLPTSKFEKPINDILISKDKKTKIFFEYNITDWMYQDEGEPLFYKVKDAVDYYSKELSNLKIQNINDGFIINGKNASNELVFIKGLYTELSSMEGRASGNPKWLWSNTVVLKIVMSQADIVDFNSITEIVNKGFNVDSISFKE